MAEPGDWFRDPRMWLEFAPVVFDQRRLGGTAGEVDRVLALVGLEKGAVLDVCCGVGRHSLELARRGFAAVGVDITPGYLEQARATAAAEGIGAEFVEADVREFRRPGAFDAAICMFTSFGYFEDLADDRKVLANVAASLRPGGALLIQTMGKEAIAQRRPGRTWGWLEDSPGDLFLSENTVLGAWERVQLDWTIIRADGSRAQARMRIRIYSALELTSLLRDAGFSDVAVFGDLEGHAYGPGASALVAVAKK